MKIYLSQNTAGRYGGLERNLYYLHRLIEGRLRTVGFKSSFEALWLTLAYPPMYVLPGVAGIEKTFEIYYDKFPISRLDRRNKKVDITVKAPEFSEYFDKEKRQNYQHKFDIEPQYKNISETDIGKILIDKFLMAGEMIAAKLKKEDAFDHQVFKDVLNGIREEINIDFLASVNVEQQEQVQDNLINRALELREKRKHQELPKDKLIRDLRVYDKGLPNKALYPYDYQYSEIFLNLLARDELRCPKYHHLYIQVAQTMDEALKASFSIEDWYVNGLAVIDFDDYQQLSEKQKESRVFDLIVAGLKDIASLDQLDLGKIEKVIRKIAEKGLDTELLFKEIENNTHLLKITYLSRSMEEGCPVFFNLTDKTTQQTKRTEIGRADKDQLRMWLQKISLSRKQIKVRSSPSVRGEVWLKGMPMAMEFEIEDLMK